MEEIPLTTVAHALAHCPPLQPVVRHLVSGQFEPLIDQLESRSQLIPAAPRQLVRQRRSLQSRPQRAQEDQGLQEAQDRHAQSGGGGGEKGKRAGATASEAEDLLSMTKLHCCTALQGAPEQRSKRERLRPVVGSVVGSTEFSFKKELQALLMGFSLAFPSPRVPDPVV